MTEPPPRVFTVVLNHRHADDTLRCLDSVRRSTYRGQFPVVVDNASGPDQVEKLRETLPTTTLLCSEDNLGYAGGNNLGIRHALDRDADYVWILNPDTTVAADALDELLAVAREHPEAGILGSRVLYGGSRPLTVSSDGGLLDWARGGATHHRHDGVPAADVPGAGSLPADFVTGSSMLVDTAVFEDVGFLPEDYFLYFEETEFAVRARAAGWEPRVALASQVNHFKRSFGPLPAPYYVYYYIRARLLFGVRHSDKSADELEADLDDFVMTWRDRVVRNAPGWVATYDQLVRCALDDGRAGRTGRRDDVHDVEPGQQAS